MKKTKIYLIRHTETIGNIENRLVGIKDYPLSKQGKENLKILNTELENIKFDVAYCSLLNRTKATIEYLTYKNNIDIIQKKELDEMNFGIYDGWKWEDVNKVDPSVLIRQKQTGQICEIKGQETSEDVAKRMYKCILDICTKNKGKTILICSHGVAIEAFLRYITNRPWNKSKKKYCQYNMAINELEYSNQKFKILRLADIDYIKKVEKKINNYKKNAYKSHMINKILKVNLHNNDKNLIEKLKHKI